MTYTRYTTIETIGGNVYFIFVSFCIWGGCKWIHLKLRRLYSIKQNPFSKISLVCIIASLYSFAIAGLLALTWMTFSKEAFSWIAINKFIFLSILAVIVFTLVYEILYLSKEREFDTRVVNQLDHDLSRAEMIALRNTLDPHFIFNSLNTLSHLISNDSKKADVFNNKLAEVYKYFLLNKDKEVISLDKEIEFINNYYALLQIRHGNKLELHIRLENKEISDILIVPCALQILVENVIKHNTLNTSAPLHISIEANDNFLVIQNNIIKKRTTIDSTRTGLKILASQYTLIFNTRIIVEDSKDIFIVKLPLLKKNKSAYV